MSGISDVFPPVETALELEPEELAAYVLEYLCREEDEKRDNAFLHRGNFTGKSNFEEYAGENLTQLSDLCRVVSEAWVWLLREGLIAPYPGGGHNGEKVFVTRRGRKFREKPDIRQYKATNLLNRENLDQKLADEVLPIFLRGNYSSAVFTAFKEVEIRVRDLGGYDKKDIGVDLMRMAFHPGTGNLADLNQEHGEREGLSHVFAGAIACFKNPGSHRNVDLEDPVEAAELIGCANLLIRIAERHKR